MKSRSVFFVVCLFCAWLAGCNGEQTVLSVVVNPLNPNVLYAGATGGGFYKSTDGGATFSRLTQGLSRYNISTIAINPSFATVLYAGTYGDHIYRSVDGARSWMLLSDGLSDNVGTQAINALVMDPQAPEVLYAGTNHGVYKSADGGGQWKAVNMGIGNRFAIALAMDPLESRILIAGTNQGIYRTQDAAATWRLVDQETRSWAVNVLVFSGRNLLYAGTDRGVFVLDFSRRPVTWRSGNDGLRSLFVSALVADVEQPDRLYAGNNDGVHITTDGARSWRLLPGAPGAVTSLAMDTRRAALFVGTTSGLYKGENRGARWTQITLPHE